MPNAPTKFLERELITRTRERNNRLVSIGAAFDQYTAGVERNLLAAVANPDSSVEAARRRVGRILANVPIDMGALMEKRIRRLWPWVYDSASDAMVDSLPLATWINRIVPVPVLREAAGDVAFELEVQPILDGKVSVDGAKSIVRKIEFPPPSPDMVEAIMSDTVASDGLSAWGRIKTIAATDSAAFQERLVGDFAAGRSSRQLAQSIRQFVHRNPDGTAAGINYKAQRIARTEGVRISEAGLQSSWENVRDVVDAMEFHNAHVPDSREEHIEKEGTYHRTGGGDYVRADGTVLPIPPLGPNCLCWTTPVLADDLTAGLPERNLGAYASAKARADQQIAVAS